MTEIEALRVSVAAALALALSCSDGGGGGGPTGRGTPACHEWQAAVCDWIVKCPVFGAPSCNQVKGITCKSDAEAVRCASAFRAASCGGPPANCDIPDIADPAPAVKGCNDYKAAACQRLEECQITTRDDCLQQITSLDCDRAVGIALTYEKCIAEFRTLACSSSGAPASCSGAILLR